MNAFMHGFLDELEKTAGIRSRIKDTLRGASWKSFKRHAKKEGPIFLLGATSGFGAGVGAGLARGKALGRRESKENESGKDKKKKKWA